MRATSLDMQQHPVALQTLHIQVIDFNFTGHRAQPPANKTPEDQSPSTCYIVGLVFLG